MGKYRPWIIFGAPVLGILIFLLFTAPELSAGMKIVYAYVVYIAYSLASTVVNIPYHSLTPVCQIRSQSTERILKNIKKFCFCIFVSHRYTPNLS